MRKGSYVYEIRISLAIRMLKKRGAKLDAAALRTFALLRLTGIAASMSLRKKEAAK